MNTGDGDRPLSPRSEGGLPDLAEAGVAVLRRYARLLADAPLNLVAAADRDDVYTRHILEATAVTQALGVTAGESWLDLGTGGGLPGIVIAILHPEAQVALVDARAKKIRAVERIVEELALTHVRCVAGRAERLARSVEQREAFDGVVCRALGPLVTSVELARGFARPGATIAVVRGRDARAECARLRPLAARLGISDPSIQRVKSEPRETWLVRMRAQGSPPTWVPRRDGLPRAEPLDGPRCP